MTHLLPIVAIETSRNTKPTGFQQLNWRVKPPTPDIKGCGTLLKDGRLFIQFRKKPTESGNQTPEREQGVKVSVIWYLNLSYWTGPCVIVARGAHEGGDEHHVTIHWLKDWKSISSERETERGSTSSDYLLLRRELFLDLYNIFFNILRVRYILSRKIYRRKVLCAQRDLRYGYSGFFIYWN
jgi:hypothetical protein